MNLQEIQNIINLNQSSQLENQEIAYQLYISLYRDLSKTEKRDIELSFIKDIDSCETFCVFLYQFKGLNSIYAFLKRNKIKYDNRTYEFGYATTNGNGQDKLNFLQENRMHFHLYSESVQCKNGFSVNKLRGRKIIIEL